MGLGISYAGYRNGFPFRVGHKAPGTVPTPFSVWDFTGTKQAHHIGQGTTYPIGFTLSEMAEIYWRIKAWTVDANLTTAVASEGFTASGTCNATDVAVDFFGDPITSEVKMIPSFGIPGSNVLVTASGESTWEKSDATPPEPSSGVGRLIVGFTIVQDFIEKLGQQVRYYDGLYWPMLQAYARAIPLGSNTEVELDANTSEESYTVKSSITCTVLGKPLNFYNQSGALTSGTIDITPSEWWGYGGKFDTATGARL